MIRGSYLTLCQDALAIAEPSHSAILSRYLMAEKTGLRMHDNNAPMLSDDAVPVYVDSLIEIINGVAIVPIHEVMVKRTQIWESWYGCGIMLGSDDWAEAIDRLVDRNDIRAIVIDLDTPGGQVAGTERFGQAIREARAEKEVIGVVNEMACSGGLWLLSQCGRTVINPTGKTGSLGVYRIHYDDTKGLAEQWGVEKTVIYRGQYKGIDERALDTDSKADLQRYIDDLYAQFVDAVALGLQMPPSEVVSRWGDSRILTGSEAVSSGLVDEVGTLQGVLNELGAGHKGRASISVPADVKEEYSMLKVNDEGKIVGDKGQVLGSVSELGLSAAVLATHCKTQVDDMIQSAVSTAKAAADETAKAELAKVKAESTKALQDLVTAVGPEAGVAAFVAGKSVVEAKADLADTLAAAATAKDAEIAKLKEQVSAKLPTFVPSDRKASDGKAADSSSDLDGMDPEVAAAWTANEDNCQAEFGSAKVFAAYKRNARR